MTQRKYDEHDIETASMLAQVEVRLEHVEENVKDFRSHNDKRLDELREMLVIASAQRCYNTGMILSWICVSHR